MCLTWSMKINVTLLWNMCIIDCNSKWYMPLLLFASLSKIQQSIRCHILCTTICVMIFSISHSWESLKIVEFFCRKSYYLLFCVKDDQHISKEIYAWSRFIFHLSLYLWLSTIIASKNITVFFNFFNVKRIKYCKNS